MPHERCRYRENRRRPFAFQTQEPARGSLNSVVAKPAGSQSALREANSARILDAVRSYGGITQVELAEATGLSPATVSTIVKQLLAAGAVDTRNTVRSGRRAQLVTLAHQYGLLVGVHVSLRGLRIVVADSNFTTLEERILPLPFDHRADTTLDRAALMIVELTETLGSELDEILGIGVSIPAPVDPATGIISLPSSLRGWEDVPIAEVLSARLKVPVHVDNDANLGALGEARLGAGRGVRNLLFIVASYTVGAGIMIDGQIHHGIHGTAGEIGHSLVDPLGAVCRCGSRGCLNAVVGAQHLIDSLQVSHGPLSLTELIRLAQEGDPGCSQVVEDAGAAVGTVIANTATAMSPSLIIVGGELAQTGDLFLEPARSSVARRVILNIDGALPIVPAQLGAHASVMGALALASDHAVATRGPISLSSNTGSLQ